MLREDPFAAAEMVAAWAVSTVATFALNEAAVDPAGTGRVAGTATLPLLLPSATVTPPAGAGPVRVTRQGSESAPVMEVLLQEIALTLGTDLGSVPVPVTPTLTAPALLEMTN
jgi:hypothetical protein